VSIFLAWFKNHWLQVTLKGAKAERLRLDEMAVESEAKVALRNEALLSRMNKGK
jgi:hypothetical protein